jgi:metal-sulfur cluster biosynthetic enzyme
MAVTKEQIIEQLKLCLDPELLIDVHTLGLIYDIRIKEDLLEIDMTFTFPGCPYGPMLKEDVTNKLKAIKGVKDVKLNITFDPPWKPSDELRAMLGM